MRVIWPIGRPGGNSDGSRSLFSTVPRVTTRSPAFSRALGAANSSTRSFGLPALAADTTPKTELRPPENASAETCDVVSVISVTCEEPLKASVTVPIRASSLMTGWPLRKLDRK